MAVNLFRKTGPASVVHRSALNQSNEEKRGWLQDRLSAGGRQVEGLFTTQSGSSSTGRAVTRSKMTALVGGSTALRE